MIEDMTNEEKLSKALQDFKTKYPSITSADLQTFIIGWQEAVKNCNLQNVVGSALLNDVLNEQEEIISNPHRFNGVHIVRIKQVFAKYGIIITDTF